MTYRDELESLGETWGSSLNTLGNGERQQVADLLSGHPVVALGSGGTRPAAELLALLHTRITGLPAQAMTSLEFLESADARTDSAVVIFSARAKHPDTALTVRSALALEIPVVLVTAKSRAELGELNDDRIHVLQIAHLRPDGFLATASLLSMCALVAEIYGETVPEVMSKPSERLFAGMRDRLLVLHSSSSKPAAIDIEVRMHELGLADVQLVDYRNFAHGRHVGFARRVESTTLIALSDNAIRELAERTLRELPADADVRHVRTPLDGTAASIELLAQVMWVPLALSPLADPAKPKVGAFGRSLYHLPYRSMFKRPMLSPAEHKVLSADGQLSDTTTVLHYEDAYRKWRSKVRATAVRGLVLDWDGTCVETENRWSPPLPAVQEGLLRALGLGLKIVFATGRGDSLWRDLRSWIPEGQWSLVQLELHNCAWQQALADEVNHPAPESNAWVPPLVRAFEPFVASGRVELRVSSTQVSIRSLDIATGVNSLLKIAQSTFREDEVIIAMSAHSVDVVDLKYGKARAIERAHEQIGQIIAIGDQGHPGGNDFAMLRATDLSISVDRVSPALENCWRIAGSPSGPRGLIDVLDRLERSGEDVRLRL